MIADVLLEFGTEKELGRTQVAVVRLGAAAMNLDHVQLKADGGCEHRCADVAGVATIFAAIEGVFDQMLLKGRGGWSDKGFAKITAQFVDGVGRGQRGGLIPGRVCVARQRFGEGVKACTEIVFLEAFVADLALRFGGGREWLQAEGACWLWRCWRLGMEPILNAQFIIIRRILLFYYYYSLGM